MPIDVSLTHWINSFAGQTMTLDLFMLVIAKYVVLLMVLVIALRWWAGDRPYERHVVISCGLASALALLANQVILLFYDRVRPYDAGVSHALVPPSPDPSFPSDHSTLAFAIAAMLLLKHHRLAPWFLVVAAVIAISRVYIGVHYVSDVFGGAVMGTLAAVLVNAVYRQGNALDRRLVALL